jgi:predicted ATPase
MFFSQLLLTLNRNGLVRLDFESQRWVWDEEKICSMRLPDNVALCFASGIKKLPFEVQCALRTLSMFGASVKISYLTELEKNLNLDVLAPLQAAAADGLVSYVRGAIQFNHNHIQEVVYGMIDEQLRHHNHLIYGDCLVKLSEEAGDVDMMFMGVHQINLGGPSAVNDVRDLVTMVRYNLTAGKRAMEMSGFASAFQFFSCGVQFLPTNHWSEHYNLSLELYELASKAALVTGKDRSFSFLSDEVLNHATCFEDKLSINYTIISGLVSTAKVTEAWEMGRAILSRLGEDIPRDSSGENLGEHIRTTQALIKGMSEDDLLNYKMMTDDIHLMKMKFLAKTASIAILVAPDLHPFITLKMIKLTISHGELRETIRCFFLVSSSSQSNFHRNICTHCQDCHRQHPLYLFASEAS